MELLDIMKNALDKATHELDQASYLSECGANAGIRKMNDNKVEWLRWVVYLAQHGLEEEQRRADQVNETAEEAEDGGWMPFKCEDCVANKELAKLVDVKDKIIEDLTNKLKSLQVTYDCEVEYRKALAERAMIDHFTQVIKIAHERCWLDGTVLVTPVEYLDRCLLELIKE